MVEVKFGQEEIAAANRELAGQTPQTILRWAVQRFHPRLTMATAFGAEGCCLIHMLAEIEPAVRIFNLETGYQFPETLRLRDQIAQRYGIVVELVGAETTVPEYEASHGGPLYNRNPDPSKALMAKSRFREKELVTWERFERWCYGTLQEASRIEALLIMQREVYDRPWLSIFGPK